YVGPNLVFRQMCLGPGLDLQPELLASGDEKRRHIWFQLVLGRGRSSQGELSLQVVREFLKIGCVHCLTLTTCSYFAMSSRWLCPKIQLTRGRLPDPIKIAGLMIE